MHVHQHGTLPLPVYWIDQRCVDEMTNQSIYRTRATTTTTTAGTGTRAQLINTKQTNKNNIQIVYQSVSSFSALKYT